MNSDRIAKWLRDVNRHLKPPGCAESFTCLPGHDKGCCTVGIVNEHRFAFYFWAHYSTDTSTPHAALITIDAHNDVGQPSEVIPDDLDNLNIHSQIELGLFTWLRLRSLNDGHILPALHLNFFSDVYVLQNDREDSPSLKANLSERQQKDRYGREHKVKIYYSLERLLYDLPIDCPVFLDIDLDYFTVENPDAGSVLGSENLVPDSEIRSFFLLTGLW